MMTLTDAIHHAEQVADSYKDTAPDCRCAVEHRQLAEWLKELQSIVHCEECKYTDGEPPIADGRSWCVLHGSFMYYCSDGERGAMKEADRFPTDDITWCMAECVTDCPRQPRYIRDKLIPHSFADFSGICMGYQPKGDDNEYDK